MIVVHRYFELSSEVQIKIRESTFESSISPIDTCRTWVNFHIWILVPHVKTTPRCQSWQIFVIKKAEIWSADSICYKRLWFLLWSAGGEKRCMEGVVKIRKNSCFYSRWDHSTQMSVSQILSILVLGHAAKTARNSADSDNAQSSTVLYRTNKSMVCVPKTIF